MAVSKENNIVTITLEYSNFTLTGTLIATFSNKTTNYLVVETVDNIFVFNYNDVTITKTVVVAKDVNSVFTYYSKNQISGFMSRIFADKVQLHTPRLGVSVLSIEQSDDTNTVTFGIKEDTFISEVTGKTAHNNGKDTSVTDIIPINNTTMPNTVGGRYNGYNNSSGWSGRKPKLLGNLHDIFKVIIDEDNRKPIGHATVGGSGSS